MKPALITGVRAILPPAPVASDSTADFCQSYPQAGVAPAFHRGGGTFRSVIVSNTDVVLCQAVF